MAVLRAPTPGHKVLFVCLGNICRSPTVEGVARRLAQTEFPELRLQFDSAGTGDYHIGEAPDRRSQQAALRRGYDLSSLRARQLSAADFASFDLLLAMDGENLESMRAIAPAGARSRVRLFLTYAPDAGFSDVPDPYYASPDGFETVLDLAEHGCRALFVSLAAGFGRR